MSCESWPIVWPCPTDTVDPALVDAAQVLAGNLLAALSGYRLGICAYTEAYRPACTGGCPGPYKDFDGNWRNGWWGRDCCRLLLSHRPAVDVSAVWENGALLDPTGYDIEGSYLRRRGACWPCGNTCDDPPIALTYRAGIPYPAGTGAAVGEVACEYLSALQGGQCRLPSRATSITRQGVTVTLDTAADFVKRGRIGLPITDAWLTSVNRGGLTSASRVYSPDLPRVSPAVVVVAQ